jgi:peptide/nickel transport system ATP-binding protein
LYRNAGHPYTRALLSAVPSMDPDRRTARALLAGDPPNPVDPPPGCRFRDRCPEAAAVCATNGPRLIEVAPGHGVACLMADPRSGHPQAAA